MIRLNSVSRNEEYSAGLLLRLGVAFLVVVGALKVST